ncbi:PilZ domain-containing protein [Erythrobacter sp.]|jgi:hypothetical protein|uniref:PilZ domain-containing protein n=1 Tax=Erythrobacter sp. TaxID=1042 RepID=UPI002EBB6DD1|nr:PilZ domain-containing protein [Erythrobacter sp.]
MSFLAARNNGVCSDRRRSERFEVALPVIFRTTSGDRRCHLANISDHGAKLETDDPPAKGVSGMLILDHGEFYCTVSWSNGIACGIEFERSIGEAKLTDLVGEKARQGGPAANCSNIQMGRKRGSLVSG